MVGVMGCGFLNSSVQAASATYGCRVAPAQVGTSGHGLRDFLQLEAQHWPIKLKEFVLDPKRAHAAMSRYRAKHSCWDSTIADFLRRMAKVRF